jgi:hypothetical protein
VFGEHREVAINGYERFVAEGNSPPSPWEHLKNQVYLGSDQFVDEMQRRIDGSDRLSEILSSQRRPLARFLKHYADVASYRNEPIVLSYASRGYRMKEIGNFFGLHYSSVSRIVREAKRNTSLIQKLCFFRPEKIGPEPERSKDHGRGQSPEPALWHLFTTRGNILFGFESQVNDLDHK